MPRLEHFFLGPFSVKLAGKPVTGFESDKVRALLAYLAVEAGRAHSRDALCALIWPDQPDDTTRQNLRHVLYKLRQALSDTERDGLPAFLLVTPQTVQLNPDADTWLDVTAFSERVLSCRSHRHRSVRGCPACIGRLREAAALYRGDFLEGFSVGESEPFEEWLLIVQEGLHRQALEAFAHLAEYYQARGEYELALDYARRQIGLEPWREEAHRQVMRLLALTGQRAAALAQYDTCRHALATQLGIEPETETRALYELIRDGAQQGAGAPEGADTDLSALLGVRTPPHNLPPQLTPFVGREDELAQLAELLQDPEYRLVTLTGPGGIGKTRLALRAAAGQAGAFEHGIFFVSLASVASLDFLASPIARATGLALQGRDEPQAQLIDYLSRKEMLLVLDNFEHLLAGVDLIVEILQRAPGVNLLVTSREHLGLQAESVFDISGLRFPEWAGDESGPVRARDGSTDALAAYSAVQLFVERARRVQRSFSLSPETAAGVAQVCALVAGVPLAIELAAARAGQFAPSEIAGSIRRSLDFLATSFHDVPLQHRSLRAVFDYSWGLLSGEERVAFRKLAVFRGGWYAEAAEQIAGSSRQTLGSLAAKSLVQRDESGRYGIHELLRQYASERLDEEPEECGAVQARHAGYYLEFVESAAPELRGPRQKVWLDSFEKEHDNLRAALSWALEQQQAEAALSLATKMRRFWEIRGYLAEGRRWLEAALALGDAPKLLRARALSSAAALATLQSDHTQTIDQLQEALALYRELGDKDGVAEALNNLGAVMSDLNEYRRSLEYFEEALPLRRETGNMRSVALLLYNIGTTLVFLGDVEPGAAYLEECVSIYREMEDQWGVALALQGLAMVPLAQADFRRAGELSSESAAFFRELGDKSALAISLVFLGQATLYSGDAGSELYFREALETFTGLQEEIGPFHAECLEGLAAIFGARGDPEKAALLFGAAEALRETIDVSLTPAMAPPYDRTVAAAREQLDSPAWHAAWWEGRALAVDQAIAYALEDA
jgi:predicted ATPase/DNA-binding SARP family transcriptional activator